MRSRCLMLLFAIILISTSCDNPISKEQKEDICFNGPFTAQFTPRETHASVVFQGNMWVIGGGRYEGEDWVARNDVWYS